MPSPTCLPPSVSTRDRTSSGICALHSSSTSPLPRRSDDDDDDGTRSARALSIRDEGAPERDDRRWGGSGEGAGEGGGGGRSESVRRIPGVGGPRREECPAVSEAAGADDEEGKEEKMSASSESVTKSLRPPSRAAACLPTARTVPGEARRNARRDAKEAHEKASVGAVARWKTMWPGSTAGGEMVCGGAEGEV